MSYGERAFFEGEPCAHCAAYEERAINAARLYVKRRTYQRGNR